LEESETEIESMSDPKPQNSRASEIDFIIIGAAKSGTTWLADMLRQHPKVFIPEWKELHYFNPRFADAPELENLNHAKPIEWYLRFFEGATPDQIKGEATPAYMWDEPAAKKIQQFNPNIKLIAILREPVARAFSHYLHWKHKGVVISADFRQGIIEREDILGRGLYYAQLKQYADLFPSENMKIVLFDDLQNDGRKLLEEIEGFLGIEKFIPENIDAVSNVSRTPRYWIINKFLTTLRLRLRRSKLNFVTDIIRGLGLARLAMKIMQSNARVLESKPTIPADLQASLKQYYQEDIEKLEKFINRDLSSWKA